MPQRIVAKARTEQDRRTRGNEHEHDERQARKQPRHRCCARGHRGASSSSSRSRSASASASPVEHAKHWLDDVSRATFTREQREHTTILVSRPHHGARPVHPGRRCAASATRSRRSTCPDNDALQFGKEFGNRGQCNPTYFTVGNLVKYLDRPARRAAACRSKDIVENYVFLTAGACGPCRFGMYVTEYRKALRDAGFDGFRVMLFQQTGRPQAGDRRGASASR